VLKILSFFSSALINVLVNKLRYLSPEVRELSPCVTISLQLTKYTWHPPSWTEVGAVVVAIALSFSFATDGIAGHQ
jgi:hypothetical protein